MPRTSKFIAVVLTALSPLVIAEEAPLAHSLPLDACASEFKGYHCATKGLLQPVDEETLFDSGCVDDFVIFHFGKDVTNAGAWAARATDAGVPSLAIPSVTLTETVSVIVNGVRLTSTYDQQAFNQLVPEYIEPKLRGRLHGDIKNCGLFKAG